MILRAEEWDALALSLKVSFWAVVISLPLAIVVAWLLARREFPGKALLSALVHVPLVLPPVVTGYLLLLTFGRNGAVGRWMEDTLGLVLAFRWTGAVLAAAIMGFPLIVRAIRLAIEAVDPRLEDAASTLGAPPVARFFLVTFPLIIPGILAGAVLGFAKAIGEFGATITFVANIPGETQTLPSAVYSFLQVPGAEGSAMRLVVLSLCVAIGAVLVSEWLSRRVAERIGRS